MHHKQDSIGRASFDHTSEALAEVAFTGVCHKLLTRNFFDQQSTSAKVKNLKNSLDCK